MICELKFPLGNAPGGWRTPWTKCVIQGFPVPRQPFLCPGVNTSFESLRATVGQEPLLVEDRLNRLILWGDRPLELTRRSSNHFIWKRIAAQSVSFLHPTFIPHTSPSYLIMGRAKHLISACLGVCECCSPITGKCLCQESKYLLAFMHLMKCVVSNCRWGSRSKTDSSSAPNTDFMCFRLSRDQQIRKCNFGCAITVKNTSRPNTACKRRLSVHSRVSSSARDSSTSVCKIIPARWPSNLEQYDTSADELALYDYMYDGTG